MDQFTALEFLNSLHERKPNSNQHAAVAPQVRHVPARSPRNSEMLLQGLLGNSKRLLSLSTPPWRQYRKLARSTRRQALHRLRSSAEGKEQPSHEAHFAAAASVTRVFEGLSIPLPLLSRVAGSAPGAELEHVITLICSECTRRYLQKLKVGNPDKLLVRMQVPTRNAGAHALAGNHHALREIETFGHVTDPLERLTALASAVDGATDHGWEQRGQQLRARYEGLPAMVTRYLSKQANYLALADDEQETIGIHLATGSKHSMYLLGAEMTCLTSLSPLLDGCGLVFTATTYTDRLHLSFTSDTGKIPEPLALKAELEEVVADLESQTRVKMTQT